VIAKRKRMMDSVGHYARPELLHLVDDTKPAAAVELTQPFPFDPLVVAGGESHPAQELQNA
jgi:hypothetical protein